jgi:hypothetical protein
MGAPLPHNADPPAVEVGPQDAKAAPDAAASARSRSSNLGPTRPLSEVDHRTDPQMDRSHRSTAIDSGV